MPQRLTNHLFRLHSDFFSCAAVVQKALFIYMTLNSLFCRGSRNVFPTPPFLVAAFPGRRVSWSPRFLVAALPERRGQARSLHLGDVEAGRAPVFLHVGDVETGLAPVFLAPLPPPARAYIPSVFLITPCSGSASSLLAYFARLYNGRGTI